jgi:hypothetical protein
MSKNGFSLFEIVAAIFIIGGAVFFILRFFKSKSPLKEIQVEILKASDVIAWFKNDDIMKRIDKEKILPIIVKDKEVENLISKSFESKQCCLVCILDRKRNKIIEGEMFVYNEMDEDLKKMFGEKDMIIFK